MQIADNEPHLNSAGTECFFTFHVSKTTSFSIPRPLSKNKRSKTQLSRNSSKELPPGSSTSCASCSPLDSYWRWTMDHCIFQLPGEGWRSRRGLEVQEYREALPSALSTIKPYPPITRHQPSYVRAHTTARRCSGLFIHPVQLTCVLSPHQVLFFKIYIFIYLFYSPLSISWAQVRRPK